MNQGYTHHRADIGIDYEHNFGEQNGFSIVSSSAETARKDRGFLDFTGGYVTKQHPKDEICCELANKPEILITRGYFPGGDKFGTKSSIENQYTNTFQMFGMMGLNTKDERNREFIRALSILGKIPLFPERI